MPGMYIVAKNHVKSILWISCLLLVVFSSGCMKKFPYLEGDEKVARFLERDGNLQLHFTTDKGRQTAFYLPPFRNPTKPPDKLIILYPGIHAVALGWLNFIRLREDVTAGYLLIDYPGRGYCEGNMRPEQNYKNTLGALDALAKHFDQDDVRAEISLLGHSFGSGAALQFALHRDVDRIVLVAPFNTLTEAVARQSRLLAFIMPSEIDNVGHAKTLLQKEDPPEITVIHGRLDTSLPVGMGREIAAVDPQRIMYYEINGGDHSSILTTHRDLIFSTLLGVKGVGPSALYTSSPWKDNQVND